MLLFQSVGGAFPPVKTGAKTRSFKSSGRSGPARSPYQNGGMASGSPEILFLLRTGASRSARSRLELRSVPTARTGAGDRDRRLYLGTWLLVHCLMNRDELANFQEVAVFGVHERAGYLDLERCIAAIFHLAGELCHRVALIRLGLSHRGLLEVPLQLVAQWHQGDRIGNARDAQG